VNTGTLNQVSKKGRSERQWIANKIARERLNRMSRTTNRMSGTIIFKDAMKRILEQGPGSPCMMKAE
jgi:hypothetical protein